MRIISKFKDYYDFPQKWGYDPKIVYVRKTSFGKHALGWVRCHILSKRVVGFAGKLYPVWSIDSWGSKSIYFFNEANAIKYVKDNEKQLRAEYQYSFRYSRSIKHALGIVDWRNQVVDYSKFAVLFETAPIFIAGSDDVEFNPCFRRWHMEGFMEATKMYQDLSSYMSNVWAISQPEIPVPSDKDMVSIKGFDKYSFRKDPSKKRK